MYKFVFFLMIRRPPRSTLSSSSAASDVYKRQVPVPVLPVTLPVSAVTLSSTPLMVKAATTIQAGWVGYSLRRLLDGWAKPSDEALTLAVRCAHTLRAKYHFALESPQLQFCPRQLPFLSEVQKDLSARAANAAGLEPCLLYTSPSPRDS
eukprot:TRINITY_DN44176_c0_g2_i1.p2 TRINITY_DN44176_c0_g2~~TRINITY_DN44176_c0_g2_i1.p2  ORF type:complete len:150 (+),score=45.28 TRINITY_DN44176_c0_g2_i1:38-487(+)